MESVTFNKYVLKIYCAHIMFLGHNGGKDITPCLLEAYIQTINNQ